MGSFWKEIKRPFKQAADETKRFGKKLDEESRRIDKQILDETNRVGKALDEESRRINKQSQSYIGMGTPEINYPEQITTPIPVQSMRLEADAIRRDMMARRKAAMGRSQSNKQLQPLVRQSNRPQLGTNL